MVMVMVATLTRTTAACPLCQEERCAGEEEVEGPWFCDMRGFVQFQVCVGEWSGAPEVWRVSSLKGFKFEGG